MENEIPSPGRTPTRSDLLALCRELNARGARYVVIGGFAVSYHGFIRATEDIDILIDVDLANQGRVKKALEVFLRRPFSSSATTISATTWSSAFRTTSWSM